MFVAGIDAHTTYSVIAIVNNAGDLVHGPERIPNAQVENLESLLDRFRPVEVVVETCPSWPWLFDRLRGPGIHFVLAHAKRLKVIADSNYKRDDLDAELLARMRLAGLIAHLWPMIKALDKRVERMGQEIPAVALLRTIPGIGPYRALLIATETMPIERFPKPAHLVSYAGLASRSSQSGLRPIRHGSIPAGANRWLRGTFVRAVVTPTTYAPDSWLSKSYEQIRQRLGWQVARVATARRLARVVHAMLRTGETWRDKFTYREKGELPWSACRITTTRFC